jgi:hypothetical protein
MTLKKLFVLEEMKGKRIATDRAHAKVMEDIAAED